MKKHFAIKAMPNLTIINIRFNQENTAEIIEMCLEDETRHENGEQQMVNGKVKLTFKSSFIAFLF